MAAVVGGVWGVFSDGVGGDGRDGGFAGEGAGGGWLVGLRIGAGAGALRDSGHAGLGEVCVQGCETAHLAGVSALLNGRLRGWCWLLDGCSCFVLVADDGLDQHKWQSLSLGR